MKKLLVFFVLLSLSAFAQAATYYVSNSASNGFSVGFNTHTTTDAQSMAKPWLTISTANVKSSDGDTLIVNDGTYTESAGVGYLSIDKNLTVTPYSDYGVTVKSLSATRVVNIQTAGKTITLGKIVIDGEYVRSYPLHIGINTLLTLNGTWVKNGANYAILADGVSGDTVMNGAILTGTATVIAAYYESGSRTVSGSLTISSVTISETGITNAAGGGIVWIPAITTGTFSMTNSVITSSGNVAHSSIRVANTSNALISGNTIQYMHGTGYGIWSYSSAAANISSSPVIVGNIVNHNGTAGIMILAGTDGSGVADNRHNDARIYGNICTGSVNSTTLHGIMVGSAKGGIVFGNKVSYATLPLLSKLSSGTSFVGNEVKNIQGGTSGSGMRSKGSTNITFAHNGIYLNQTSYGAYTDHDTVVPTYSNNINYVGNNIYQDSASALFATVASSSTANFVGNNYYSTTALNANQWSYIGTSYATLAAWKAAKEPSATSNPLTSYPKKTTIPGAPDAWDTSGNWLKRDSSYGFGF